MWFLNSPLVFPSLLLGRWENPRQCFFMVSAASNFKRRSFKSFKATSSSRRLESNWISGNISKHTEKRSSTRISYTLLLFDVKSTTKQFLLLSFRGEVHAENENPFQRALMYDVVFASENHFCFRWFSLAFISSAFSHFRSGKAKKRIEACLYA